MCTAGLNCALAQISKHRIKFQGEPTMFEPGLIFEPRLLARFKFFKFGHNRPNKFYFLKGCLHYIARTPDLLNFLLIFKISVLK